MHFTKILKAFAITTFLTITATPASAQDILARQAPVDRKMKAVDTMALRILEREEGSAAIAQLYSEWNNKYAHKVSEVPDSFRIDLRNFCMPTNSRVLTSSFGPRWGRQHKGLDIKVYHGDTIRAAFDGKIRIVNYEANGYGNYVVIRHNNGLETIYGHMSKNLVRENQTVKAGTPIGLGGTTGRSTGTHLHFETRLCGIALNPALMFDFRNQDVTGDFYMYRKSTHSRESLIANRSTGKPNANEFAPAVASDDNQARANKNNSRNNRSNPKYHKVAKGETLFSIAKKHGMTVDQLCKVNRLGKKTKIRPGQILRYS